MNYALAPCAPMLSTAPILPRIARTRGRAASHRAADVAFAPRPLPSFEADVMAGLASRRKAIPPRWLEDDSSAAPDERAAQHAAYDPAATETRILERCARAIGQAAGARPVLVDFAGAAARNARLLLKALREPQAYVPTGLAAERLAEGARDIAREFPALRVRPIVADICTLDALPELDAIGRVLGGNSRRVLFCPGAVAGACDADETVALLARIARAAGPGALLVIGADATQDPALLLPAYDDRTGAMAQRALHLLARIDRDLDVDFSPSAFRYEARHDARQQCVGMHLISQYTQRVTVRGRAFQFAMGESILVGTAHQHGVLKFQHLAARAGWSHRQLWMDGGSQFAVHVLECDDGAVRAREQNVSLR